MQLSGVCCAWVCIMPSNAIMINILCFMAFVFFDRFYNLPFIYIDTTRAFFWNLFKFFYIFLTLCPFCSISLSKTSANILVPKIAQK